MNKQNNLEEKRNQRAQVAFANDDSSGSIDTNQNNQQEKLDGIVNLEPSNQSI